MGAQRKRAIVSVTNDLVTDNRVRRLCTLLVDIGFEVIFVGRELRDSPPLPDENYRMKRMKLFFDRNAFFYAEYNIRLFFFLLFKRVDILVANDLDTLLANYLVSKIKRVDLVYDSHEYFTEVPELREGSFAKRTWEALERWIVPKLKYCITVNKSIADIYQKRYKVPFMVLRNMPYRYKPTVRKSRTELGLPEDKKIIILQGNGINIQRGAEEAVLAMKYIQVPSVLLIVGNGDVIPELKKISEQEKINHRVIFKDRMPYAEMMQYTANADLGITFDKPNSLNYTLSLPNKIFDYIQAEIPVLSSKLPELERIISTYEIGGFIEVFDPEYIAQMMEVSLTEVHLRNRWKENLRRAAEELCRENEETALRKLYEQLYRK